jgi:hypothetical protein
MIQRVYKTVIRKIIHRRTASSYTDRHVMGIYDYAESKVGLKKPGGPNLALVPSESFKKDSHKITIKHLKNKFKNVKSLPLKAITRSVICTHEMHTPYAYYRAEQLYPFKSVFWDTLAPKKRIIRPAPVKKLISSKDKIK